MRISERIQRVPPSGIRKFFELAEERADVISQVNHTTVGSIAQLQSATQNLTIGQSFNLTVDRGTTAVVLTATLTNRPTKQP